MIFFADSIVRFSLERGFSEFFYIVCPVCGNASISVVRWEGGAVEERECAVCRRREGSMQSRKP